ncbi:MAG: Asp-tRNA(Asn)/Glu-tRNA(Gln) amidotransferase subunit GatC [Phycisphaerales bacterium]
MNDSPGVPNIAPLTLEDVRKVARLARLAVSGEQAQTYREHLRAVIEHADRLRGLDLASVEPMSSPMDATALPRDDVPGPTLPLETVMGLAPDAMSPFFKVSKVLGEGGGA